MKQRGIITAILVVLASAGILLIGKSEKVTAFFDAPTTIGVLPLGNINLKFDIRMPSDFMRKKLYKAQFHWDSRAISMKFNEVECLLHKA